MRDRRVFFLKKNFKFMKPIFKKSFIEKYSDFGKIFLKTLDKLREWVYNDTDNEFCEVAYGNGKKTKG